MMFIGSRYMILLCIIGPGLASDDTLSGKRSHNHGDHWIEHCWDPYGYLDPLCPQNIKNCSEVPEIENGRHDNHYSSLVGSKVSYTCNNGYWLDGNKQIVCEDKGSANNPMWSKEPQCVLVCPEPPSIVHATFVRPAEPWIENTSVKYSCDAWYTLAGNSTIWCHNGTWSLPYPSCLPPLCPEIIEISNGYHEYPYNIQIGTVVQYHCNLGYEFKDTNRTVCELSTSDSRKVTKWREPIPQCIRILCVQPYTIHNSQIVQQEPQTNVSGVTPTAHVFTTPEPENATLVNKTDVASTTTTKASFTTTTDVPPVYYVNDTVLYRCNEGYGFAGTTHWTSSKVVHEMTCLLNVTDGSTGSGSKTYWSPLNICVQGPGVAGITVSNPSFVPIVDTPTVSSSSVVSSTIVPGTGSGTNGNLGVQCLSCNAAVAPTECDSVQRCGPHENCFMDVFVSDSGISRYHLGCRDAQQCSSHNGKRNFYTEFLLNNSLEGSTVTNVNEQSYSLNATGSVNAFVAHKRSQELIVCSNCCTGTLCNSAGCGYTGYQQPRGPVCFNCPQQRTASDCDKITVCGIDQVCMLVRSTSTVSHQELYHTQCEEEVACSVKESVALIGRREVNAHCCKGELCNFELFSSSASPVYRLTSPTQVTINSPCISNPCARGTCSSYYDTYHCICEAGFFGRNCDQYAGQITTNTILPTLKSPTHVTNPLIQSMTITPPDVTTPLTTTSTTPSTTTHSTTTSTTLSTTPITPITKSTTYSTTSSGGSSCRDYETDTFKCADFDKYNFCTDTYSLAYALAHDKCAKHCGLCSLSTTPWLDIATATSTHRR